MSSIFAGKRIGGSAAARVELDGRSYLNFYGSGYLALGAVAEIRDAVAAAVRDGVPLSRQWASASDVHDPAFAAVEAAGARAGGSETSVYLPSGALLGIAGLAGLGGGCDAIFHDEGAHYNLTSAIAMEAGAAFPFAHCDADALGDVIRRELRPGQRPLVLTDGVFSTTGRVPPLRDYAEVISPYGGRLYLDEAHGFGVIGRHGRGAGDHCGVEDLALSGATLSKAYCAQGAIVPCSFEQAERIRRSGMIRGANSGSPLSAIASAASLDHVAANPHLRRELSEKVDYCRRGVLALGIEVPDTPAPIVAFRYGDRAEMLALQRRLFDDGIVIHFSTYIGAGEQGMIRCAIFRDHTIGDLDRLIAALRR